VPVGPSHNIADTCDVVGWHVLVKEVTHRVDEDLPRPSPVQRLLQLFGHESQVEALFKRVFGHTSEALGEELRIAEFAARAHLRAAADRVPRRVRPFDGRSVAHSSYSAGPKGQTRSPCMTRDCHGGEERRPNARG
jgi:hypothetical protein